MLNSSQNNTKKAIQKLPEKSFLSLPPILATFWFRDVVRCVVIYSIFRIKPMHLFSFGMSRMLKECLQNFLENPNKPNSAFKTVRRNHDISFHTIRCSLLKDWNSFIQRYVMSYSELSKRTDSFESIGSQLRELITEIGLMGVLQTADFELLDNISPYFGAFVDKLCGFHESALITKVFTKYVDLVNFIFRRNFKFSLKRNRAQGSQEANCCTYYKKQFSALNTTGRQGWKRKRGTFSTAL